MSERLELERQFLANRSLTDRILGAAARRNGLRDEEAVDFASWVQLRLIEDDYSILRRFRGESSLATYLTVVIAMLAREYRVQRWGRWRPSAAARRRGELAVRLETLVRRDGLTLEQAANVMRSAGKTTQSDRELASLFRELPDRPPLRPVNVGPDPVEETPARDGADSSMLQQESESEWMVVDQALMRTLDGLAAEDRLILRMRYWEGLSLADVARALGIPQKPLYRRVERALADLRGRLEAAGVSAEVVAEHLGEAFPAHQPIGENRVIRPSNPAERPRRILD